MRYWAREVGGWLLIFLGFLFFYQTSELAMEGRFFQLIPFFIIGLVVFRGGIHLLKVAVAAQICQQAQDRLYPVPPPAKSATRR